MTRVIPQDQLKVYQSYTMHIAIQSLTSEYYIYSGSLEVNGAETNQGQDTIWFKPRG